MYKINLKHFLCIYFFLNQNFISALTENNDNNKTLASNRSKQGRAILVNGKDYILNVAQEFVYELEEYGFCNFKLSDFNHEINQTAYFGRIVQGVVHYKNGFISTVDEISLLENPDTGTLNEYDNTAVYSLRIKMLNLMTFFDFTADLTETKFSGTVAIPIGDITFRIQVKKYFFNDLLEHNVTIETASVNNIPVVWYYEPSNSFTQIINKFADTLEIKKDLKLIETEYWYKFLGKVVDRIPFPELCLFCSVI